MANTDKNIVITPNIGSTADPSIVFSGADATTGAQNITLKAYPTNSGTLSFEGSAGQLFSVTNSLTGTIFSVNDVSGIPSIEVVDTGTIKLAQYSGNVGIGTASPTSKLDVVGTVTATTFAGLATDTVSTPSFTWSGDLTTGFYRPAASQAAVTIAGVQRGLFTATGLTVTGTVTGTQLISNIATGTAPLTVTSTTLVTNLNADLLDGLHLHTGTNNEVNKIVRTDASGYIQAGWISTTSGDNGTTALDRIYASSDGYIRYYTPTNFRTVLNVPTRTGGDASGTWAISVTGAASSNVLKAGDTMTGALTTTIGGGASDYVKHINLTNGTGYELFMLPRGGAGTYNQLTQINDAVIAFSAGAVDTGGLVIGPWSASGKGLRVNSLGNIGIGTASPVSYGAGYTTLAINNTNTGVLDLMANGVSQFRLFGNASENRLHGVTAAAMTFFTNNTEKMRIDSSGNVTPGTTNTQTLGSASLLWSNVYATTFTGALSGNATTATSVGSLTGIATVAPLVAGTAAVGTSTLGARQDHVHPLQSVTASNFASQTATTVLAAPTLAAGVPTFRVLSLEDIPDAWAKKSVRAATTANITLSAPQTIDGIAVIAGDRVLVKDQTTQATNGIYVVAAGAWTRSLDADTINELAGACVNVDSGTVNGGVRFDTDLKSTDTLGTTAVTFYKVFDAKHADSANTVSTLVIRDASGNFSANAITLGSGTGGSITGLANIQSTSYNGGQLAGLRNNIINGNMGIFQRGAAAVTVTGRYGPPDRWLVDVVGDTFSATQGAFVSGDTLYDTGGAQYYTTIAVTSVANVANYCNWGQKMEDVRILAGKTVTVSFWAKAAAGTPTIGVMMLQNFGLGGAPSATVEIAGQAQVLSTTWTKYTKSFSIPSINGKTLGTTANTGFTRLNFYLDAGSNLNTAAGTIGQSTKTVHIAQVQLEVGPVATTFEQRPIAMELALCQRYYYRNTPGTTTGARFGTGFNQSTTINQTVVTFPVEMRTAPIALEQSGTAANYSVVVLAATNACSAVPTFVSASTTTGTARFTVSVLISAGQGSSATAAAAAAYLGWNAEL